MKKTFKLFIYALFIALTLSALSLPAFADTTARQFQLNLGGGLFWGNNGLGISGNISLEPEFFFTEHTSLALRLDHSIGQTDALHLGGRFRYYFDLPDHEKWNLYLGAGIGGMINYSGGDGAELEMIVVGAQYDVGEHFKLGSDVAMDLIFNSSRTRFATKIMPIVVKWAF